MNAHPKCSAKSFPIVVFPEPETPQMKYTELFFKSERLVILLEKTLNIIYLFGLEFLETMSYHL